MESSEIAVQRAQGFKDSRGQVALKTNIEFRTRPPARRAYASERMSNYEVF